MADHRRMSRACLRILLSVPGAKSSFGFPGTVFRPTRPNGSQIGHIISGQTRTQVERREL
jgi:hypothetical protein